MIASRFHASRTSRIIQLLVVLGLLIAATQLVLSRPKTIAANEMYVPKGDKVLVFDRLATGDVAPKRILGGPDVGRGLAAVAIDTVNNLLVVSSSGGARGANDVHFLVFDRTANGNVKPKMSIKGPHAEDGPFAIYPPKKLILGTNRPDDDSLSSGVSYLGVWRYEKSSEGPPLWTIGGPNGIFQMPRGVTLDVKNKNIIASDKRLNSILTFHVPELF